MMCPCGRILRFKGVFTCSWMLSSSPCYRACVRVGESECVVCVHGGSINASTLHVYIYMCVYNEHLCIIY